MRAVFFLYYVKQYRKKVQYTACYAYLVSKFPLKPLRTYAASLHIVYYFCSCQER